MERGLGDIPEVACEVLVVLSRFTEDREGPTMVRITQVAFEHLGPVYRTGAHEMGAQLRALTLEVEALTRRFTSFSNVCQMSRNAIQKP